MKIANEAPRLRVVRSASEAAPSPHDETLRELRSYLQTVFPERTVYHFLTGIEERGDAHAFLVGGNACSYLVTVARELFDWSFDDLLSFLKGHGLIDTLDALDDAGSSQIIVTREGLREKVEANELPAAAPPSPVEHDEIGIAASEPCDLEPPVAPAEPGSLQEQIARRAAALVRSARDGARCPVRPLTVERKAELVVAVLAGRMTVAAACRRHELPRAEVERWVESAACAIERALDGQVDEPVPNHDARVRALQTKIGELVVENDRLKQLLGGDHSDDE